MKRKFLTYYEASSQIGDEEALRQAILASELAAFVELHALEVKVHSRGNVFPADGKDKFSEWEEDCFPTEDNTAKSKQYLLSGWFRLNDSSAKEVARGTQEPYCTVIAEPESAEPVTFHLPKTNVDKSMLWFRTADIALLASESEQAGTAAPKDDVGKPLGLRERTTLLCIIGALATHAKLDLSQPLKAGDAIAAMMPDVKLSGRTIGEHLKLVPEAMESRKG